MLTSRGHYGGINERSALGDFESDWTHAAAHFYEQEVAPNAHPRGGDCVWVPMGSDDVRPLRSAVSRDGGLEPKLPLNEFVRKWREREHVPLAFATPDEYFEQLAKERAKLPSRTGPIEQTLWTDWYGLNGNAGLRVRRTRADQALVAAESFCAFASTLGVNYPESEFESLWHDLLRTYSHAQMWLFPQDYEPHRKMAEQTLTRAQILRDGAMEQIAARCRVDESRACVLVFNDLPWERTEVVEFWAEVQPGGIANIALRDARGTNLTYQALDIVDTRAKTADGRRAFKEVPLLALVTVPAMGYTTVYAEPAEGALNVPAATTGERLEAGFATVDFFDGGVRSLRDEQTGAVYAGAGNVIYREMSLHGDYHRGEITATHGLSGVQVESLVSGPLRSTFRLRGTAGPHPVKMAAHFYPHARKIAFDTAIDSRGGNGVFLTTVGLPKRGTIVADEHFGVEDRDISKVKYTGVERPRPDVFHAAHWADHSDGSAGLTFIATTGEKGFEITPDNIWKHFLLMTNAQAPANDWERFITPEHAGKGLHRFDYQFLLHTGGWRDVYRRALEARHPLHAVYRNRRALPQDRRRPAEHSFATVTAPGVSVTALYKQEGRWIVRMHECLGAATEGEVRLPLRIAGAHPVNFHGERLGEDLPLNAGRLQVKLRPWQILTLAVV
jgi:alpha-mannosidase